MQVTGDLWERYMVMLTQENKLEVYGCPSTTSNCHAPPIATLDDALPSYTHAFPSGSMYANPYHVQ
jgi:hypothetical protein